MNEIRGESRSARAGTAPVPSAAAERRRPPDVERVLRWADAHRTATGQWPDRGSGPVGGVDDETWSAIDTALRRGRRGLPGGSSLARLLAEERGVTQGANPESPAERLRAWEAEQFPTRRTRRRRAVGPRATSCLTIDLILSWADAHHAANGRWPSSWSSGPVSGVPLETWPRLDRALMVGRRGLRGGITLAQLLAQHRQAPNIYTEPALTAGQIVAWAEAHRAATGRWPSSLSGPVRHAEGEHWGSIDTALRQGYRGLPGRESLGRVIRAHAGPQAYWTRPALTVEQLLAWASAHREATGAWPGENSGPVRGVPGENWNAITLALCKGSRGLPGGSSLAQLLAQHCGARNQSDLPRLTIAQVLAWADAHRAATGRWPSATSGPVAEGSMETWAIVNTALYNGYRGLTGHSSLARLLAKHRPVRPRRLSLRKIDSWARAHREATGRWPDAYAGPVLGVPDEKWSAVDFALKLGRRGLPHGSSLSALYGRSLDPAARGKRPDLTVDQVLAWADAHRAATGRWPTNTSGPVDGTPGEKWVNLDVAFRHGRRGLPRGTSLSRLIAKHRGAPMAHRESGKRCQEPISQNSSKTEARTNAPGTFDGKRCQEPISQNSSKTEARTNAAGTFPDSAGRATTRPAVVFPK